MIVTKNDRDIRLGDRIITVFHYESRINITDALKCHITISIEVNPCKVLLFDSYYSENVTAKFLSLMPELNEPLKETVNIARLADAILELFDYIENTFLPEISSRQIPFSNL